MLSDPSPRACHWSTACNKGGWGVPAGRFLLVMWQLGDLVSFHLISSFSTSLKSQSNSALEEGGHVEVYTSHSEKKKECSQSGMYLKVRVFDLVSVPAKIFRLMLWVGTLHLSC